MPVFADQFKHMGLMVIYLKGLAVIILRRDIVWCIAASWICASIWTLKPKPFPVFVSYWPTPSPRNALACTIKMTNPVFIFLDHCRDFHGRAPTCFSSICVMG